MRVPHCIARTGTRRCTCARIQKLTLRTNQLAVRNSGIVNIQNEINDISSHYLERVFNDGDNMFVSSLRCPERSTFKEDEPA